MFKKSDLLSIVLAFISTLLIVGIGFLWASKLGLDRLEPENITQKDSSNESSNASTEPDSNSNSTISPSPESADEDTVFEMPEIVPEGTIVIVNGIAKMDSINQALKKSFHRQFPGTGIETDADGSQTALALLKSGDIDLAAVERPLNTGEKAAGSIAVKIGSSTANNTETRELYYVYREPLDPDVEMFLGYVLSPIGQQIIVNPTISNEQ